jgi:hypothetical protein
MMITIASYFACITIALLFAVSLRAGARDADKLRLLINNGMVPSYIDALFTVGNFGLAMTIACTMYPTYGLGSSIVFAMLMIFVCGICMHWLQRRQFLPHSHVVHGWYANRSNEYVISLPMVRFQALAEFDLDLSNCDPPIANVCQIGSVPGE